jgi:DNA polymerase-3 subunit delta
MLNVFRNNPKEHHILKYIGALFSFYVKIFKYHELKNEDRVVVAKSLGINPYFLKDYARAAKNYNLNQTINVIQVLYEYDLKSKGVNSGSQDSYQLFKEMIFKILS